jgi:hypothetical protein
VTFRWKNYARDGELAAMTLNGDEFIRRFLLHVLPRGFVKLRHFGFVANRGRLENVILCLKLLAASSTAAPDLVPPPWRSDEAENDTADRCPQRKAGSMRLVEILLPQADLMPASPGAVQPDTS